jgi:hypothetical protein
VVSCAFFALALALALAITFPHASLAQAPDAGDTTGEAEARELFERGVELSQQERWGEALEYFRRSRALTSRPSTTFNVALALLRLGRPMEGRATLAAYLSESEGLDRESGRRAEAEELMELAVSSIAEVTLEVTPVEAEVRIDGVLSETEGTIRALALDPGSHSIRVTLDGHVAQTLEVSLLEGEHVTRSLTLAERTDPARVRVMASVGTASIHVDGEEVGRGHWTGELTPGRHRIEVRAADHEPFRRDIDVVALQRLDLTASLSRFDDSSLLDNPWLWVVVGVVVVGAGVGVGAFVASSGTAEPYGGTTGVVLQGLTTR